MKVALPMLTEERRKDIQRKLPVTDPQYIAFKSLKGILGEIDIDKMHEERINEIITKHKSNS